MTIELAEIIVGTYEEFLLGYKCIKTEGCGYSLVQSFATHSHQASIRCVAAKARFLASGSADETVHLYDMMTRKEAGVLGHHNGTVNCLEFSHNGSHLLSGGEDGSLAVCRTGNWQLEKLWGAAHKGLAVNGLSVHPTGKLALSVGKDSTLRTWNLVKGRQAYATKLGSKRGEGRQVTCVQWSPDGQLYAVAILYQVDVYSVSTAGVVHSIQLDKKVACMCFVNDDEVCVGSEGGDLSLHSVSRQTQLTMTQAHQQRVKCVAHVTNEEDGNKWLVSASSGGQVKLWHCEDGELNGVCEANTGCRVTCLVVLKLNPAGTDKNKTIRDGNTIESGKRKVSRELADPPETNLRNKKKRQRMDKGDNSAASELHSSSSVFKKSVNRVELVLKEYETLVDEKDLPNKKIKNNKKHTSKTNHLNRSQSLIKVKKKCVAERSEMSDITGQSLSPAKSSRKKKKMMKAT